MDLWNKLFSNSKRQCSSSRVTKPLPLDQSSSPCDDSIRILLFRECDRRGRKLLYDSKTIFKYPCDPSQMTGQRLCQQKGRCGSSSSTLESSETKETSISEEFVEIRNGFGYKCTNESHDVKDLGELIFGAVALAYKGSSSKFHRLTDPSRLLFSCTFPGPRIFRPQRSREFSLEDSVSSLSASMSEHLSKTETGYSSLGKTSHKTFGGLDSSPGLSVCYSEEDSGLSAPSSPFSTYGSLLSPSSPGTPMGTPSSRSGSGGSLNNSGSLNSLQKRFLRNVTTSLESLALVSDRSCQLPRSPYQVKLGLAALIQYSDESSEFIRTEQWWLEHSNVIETALAKLKLNFIEAYRHRNSFVSLSYQATEKFQQELNNLLNGPRLSEPLWLSLSSSSLDQANPLFAKLSKSLNHLLTQCDTKQSNFFISRLLTAVLTNHLGWVTTISPNENRKVNGSALYTSEDSRTSVMDGFVELPIYNAIWAQLSELTGAIGYPAKVSRTVLLGKDKNTLEHLLVILSYLIRCSQILKRMYNTNDNADQSDALHSPSSFPSLTCLTTNEFNLDSDICGSPSSQHSSSHIFELSQALTSSIDVDEPQESKWTLHEESHIKSNKSFSDLATTSGNMYPLSDQCSTELPPCKHSNNNTIQESDLKLKIYLETPESEILPMQPPEDLPLVHERKLGRSNLQNPEDKRVPISRRNLNFQKNFAVIPQPIPDINEIGKHEIAESYFGDIQDQYSSVFVLHATTQTSNWEKEIRQDLLASKLSPIIDSNPSELVTIVANCDSWDVEIMSLSTDGDKSSKDCSTFPVMMSPLVSQMTDSLGELVSVLSPQDLAEAFENILREIYLKSHILSSYLLERAQQALNRASGFRGHSLFNLSDISDKLSIDINDLPLLLAVASTHTPEVTKMFSLTYG